MLSFDNGVGTVQVPGIAISANKAAFIAEGAPIRETSQRRRGVKGDRDDQRMRDDKGRSVFEVEYGKVTYKPGAPKNAPRWIWRCTCGCGAMNGPFRTLREAEDDAADTVMRAAEVDDAQEEGRDSVHH